MKRLLIILMVLTLLAGCAPQQTPQTTEPTTTEPAATEPAGYYVPHSQIQTQTDGAVYAYALPDGTYTALFPTERGLLLADASGCVTALTGEDCVPTAAAQTEVDFSRKVAYDITESGLAYYNREKNQIVFLDLELRIQTRFELPITLPEAPVINLSSNELYYCQDKQVRAMDMTTGISRLLMSHYYVSAQLVDAYRSSAVLALRVTDRDQNVKTLAIDARTGQILYELRQEHTLYAPDGQYMYQAMDADVRLNIFGIQDKEPVSLNVDNTLYSAFPMWGAVGCDMSSGSAVLDYYDLSTGRRTAAVTLTGLDRIDVVTGDGHYLWILGSSEGEPMLCRWDMLKTPVVDDAVYTSRVYTNENPDLEGLAHCQEKADELSRTYGIRVLIWQDAVSQTGSYTAEAEYQVRSVQNMLDQLEVVLTQYPDGFLDSTIRGGTLQIGLVRSVGGEYASTQFFQDGDAYILLSSQTDILWEFVRNLAYVVDSHVLGNSRDYDDWEQLNPKGFSYTYDYAWEHSEEKPIWLQDEERAFLDELAMVNPQEDRARIFLYAMQPDTQQYFASDTMQLKLRTLCEGIREAYGMEEWEESLPWEQYLTLEMNYSNR